MRIERHPDGHLELAASAYTLRVSPTLPLAELAAGAARIGRLVLLADVDAADGPDGAVATGAPEVTLDQARGEARVRVTAASTRWRSKAVELVCREDGLELAVTVEGEGDLADVRLLGGRYPGDERWGSGVQRSDWDARSLFTAAPDDPREIVVDSRRSVILGVVGGAGPGRGRWFFTPPPLCLALSPARVGPGAGVPPGPWTSLSVEAPVADLTFPELAWEPVDTAATIRLAYEGHTRVAGTWRSPALRIRPGLADPYAAVARHRAALVGEGLAPASVAPEVRPAWWARPVFCGWGAQGHRARLRGTRAPDEATQDAYDTFLLELAARGLQPGTVVIDDRWQAAYGRGEPAATRWPDLARWIERRHAEDVRVLLWWKAWDPDGVPPGLCVRATDGTPVAVDPGNPAYRAFLAAQVRAMLAPAPGGLGADGLKIDFTARTPSGPGLVHAGTGWGIALLHELLATIHAAAKAANPEALVIAHAPHPSFAGVADAVRLNDALRLDDPDRDVDVVAQMTHRARIAAAACPGLLVETDDWAMPDRRRWREWFAVKGSLGIPSLYYTTHLDLSGEELGPADVALVRQVWADARAAAARGAGGREAVAGAGA